MGRLSYFLWAWPPDRRLTEKAQAGELGVTEVLEAETLRLLASSRSEAFVQSFTGQWLGTRLLSGIMPDSRLLKFIDQDRQAMVAERELLFAEMLRENHPVVGNDR